MLGPLDVRSGGELLTIKGVKKRRLLGLLLSRANSVVPVGDIIEALWGRTRRAAPRNRCRCMSFVCARCSQLATELPAAILDRMLGIHIDVAVAWQRASAGDWMTYAADISRRT